MSTSAERMRRHRANQRRKTNRDLIGVTITIPRDRAAEFYEAARLINRNPDLEIRSVRDTVSGRFVGLRDKRRMKA